MTNQEKADKLVEDILALNLKRRVVSGMRSKLIPENLRETLIKVGNNVASTWGATCFDFEINAKDRQILVFCAGNGEHFPALVEFDELAEEM